MKKYGVSTLFLIMGMIFFMSSAIVGAHLDSNGMLIEPAFFCVPLGFLSFATSLFTAIYCLLKNKFNKTN
ncbi:DUF3955 domain-containing protein [Enterococcus gallinarum]|uniref:DUF3955 domain-containing protein n=1 Tax=Enterococcus gallinarum TaxID=1353 RepID=UPI001AD79C9A|nr:DUF3955 domain-containing protein [Enterococcus gallinarum]MBO6420075.1 DUF3955 domain-containing protein [Enterococcus gallinarum]MBO6423072.1 DUF3955 domain-containing protein [Enterococcus gallinarum]